MIKKIIWFGLLFLIVNSCSEGKQSASNFIFTQGESRVELKIVNGNNFLFYDTPTKVDFEWKNINIKTGSIFGTGIKMLGSKNNITSTEITIPRNYLNTDTLYIKLQFEINGEKIETQFNVPVKEKN